MKPFNIFFTLLLRLVLKGDLFVSRKVLQHLAYYVLPAISLVLTLVSAGVFRNEEISIAMGSLAMNVFLVILFVSPLRRLFPQLKIFAKLYGLRRELGVLCLWLSLWHGLGVPLSEGAHGLAHWWHHMEWTHFYFWGTLGLLGMIILGVTSNNVACRFFKRNWKKIHCLVYPTFLFVLLHLILLGEGEYILVGVLYLGLRVCVWKKIVFRWKLIDTWGKRSSKA